MAFFLPDFHPDADAEMTRYMRRTKYMVTASKLLAVIADVLDKGLLPDEHPHAYAQPYSWTPLYLRDAHGVLHYLVAVFTLVGPVAPGSILRILAVGDNRAKALDLAGQRT